MIAANPNVHRLELLEAAGASVRVSSHLEAAAAALGRDPCELVIVKVPDGRAAADVTALVSRCNHDGRALIVLAGDLEAWALGAFTLLGAFVIHDQDLGDELPELALMLLSRARKRRGPAPPLLPGPVSVGVLSEQQGLTERQAQTLELLLAGVAPKQIADALGVQLSTARRHVQDTCRKFGVQNMRELLSLLARTSAAGTGTETDSAGA